LFAIWTNGFGAAARRGAGSGLALALILLLLAPALGTAAAPAVINPVLLERFEARVFADAAGRKLNYRLFKPAGANAGTNLPLVLFLHGAAGIGDDNVRQFNGGNEVPPAALVAEVAQARFPCFVFAPQCPRSDSWSSFGGQPTLTLRLTMGALERLMHEFSIDPRRLYIVGVSMGGRGVWETVLRYPEKFAAAVPICAAGDPEGLAKIKQLPVWCFHGGADTTVPVEYARKMVAALRKVGGDPKYTEYPGVGHDSYRNAFQEADLLPWLFAQRRRG
jgi:predicted peptidase